MWPIFAMYMLLIPCVALYLYFKRNGENRFSMILKGCCTGIIILTALFGMLSKPGNISAFTTLTTIGLFMGLIGDIAIGLSFVAGMLFFALGHLSYITAIFKISDNVIFGVLILIILSLMIYTLYKKSGLSFGKLLIPCASYSIIILAMLSLATTIPFSVSKGGTVLFFGAVLFTISDTLLAYINFGSKSKTNKMLDTVCLYCYFIGQSLFAVSIYYIR